MSIGLEVPMGLQCRCTVTWTECVEAIPLKGGARLAYLNMTDPDQQCPGAWRFIIQHLEGHVYKLHKI